VPSDDVFPDSISVLTKKNEKRETGKTMMRDEKNTEQKHYQLSVRSKPDE
jgi:hypothetical protein